MPPTSILKSAPPARPASAAATPLVLQPLWQPALSALVLTSGRIQIGTAADCGLRIDAQGVAEHHASVLAGPHKVVLRAWDHRTWVNDTPVKETALRSGDRVAIGPVLFRVRPATTDELLQQVPLPEQPPRELPAAMASDRSIAAEIATPVDTPVSRPVELAPSPSSADSAAAVRTAESVLQSRGPLLGEWFAAPPGGKVHEWRAEIPRPGQEPLAIPSLAPSLPQEKIDALIESRLAEHRAVWESELQAWERQQEEWLAGIAGQSAQLERRERDLNQRSTQLDRRQQELAEQQENLQREWREQHAELQALRESLQSERERLEAVTSQARAELAAEMERQAQANSEWEAAHQRLTRELANQFAAVDARRTELSARAAELAAAETALAESQAALQAERAALDSVRLEFDAEWSRWNDWRRQQEAELHELFGTVQRQQTQLAADLQHRIQSEADLLAARQALQHDRRQFSLQQAEWQNEREALWDELNRQRQRLEDDAAALECQHRHLGDLVTSLEAEIRAAQLERERLQQRTEVTPAEPAMTVPPAELLEQARLQAEAALAADRASIEQQTQAAVQRQREIEQAQQELSAEWERLHRERDALQSETSRWRDELDAELRALESRRQAVEQAQLSLSSCRQTVESLQNALEKEIAAAAAERELFEEERKSLQRQREPMSIVSGVESSTPELPLLPAACDELTAADAWPPHALSEPRDVAAEPIWPTGCRHASEGVEVENAPAQSRSLEAAEAWYASSAGKDVLAEVEVLVSAAEERSPATVVEAVELPDRDRDNFDNDWKHAPFDLTVTASERHADTAGRRESSSERPPAGTGGDRPIIDSVNSLRFELTRLFGLPEDEGDASPITQRSAAPKPNGPMVAELISDVSTDESTYAVEVSAAPSDEELDEWQTRLKSLMQHAETTPESPRTSAEEPPAATTVDAPPLPAAPTTSAAVLAAPPPPAPHEPDDSIAAYLEQLLARNRRPGDRPSAPAYEPVYESRTVGVTAPSDAAPGLDESLDDQTAAECHPDDRSHLDAAPRHQIDKHAAREKIQSFREVANISARSALARHRWRVDRAEIAVHAVLAVTTAAMGGFFFYPPLWDGEVHWPRGAGCLIASAWSLKKCLAAIHRLRKFLAMETRVKNMTTVGKVRHHRNKAIPAADDGTGWLPELTSGSSAVDESASSSPAE